MVEKILEEEFFLSAGETDAEARLSLPILVSKLIDISTAHANALGVGNPAMEHLGRGWVLSRLAIEMERYPMVNTRYRLSTWVEQWNRHFSERCYKISDAEGNALGWGRSIWMVLDTATHESTGLSHLSLDESYVLAPIAPIARQGKQTLIVECDDDEPKQMPRGTLCATAPYALHTFGYSDLDFYRHVNTVHYIELLMDQFSLETLDEKHISRLELTFAHECHYRQTVRILRSERGDDTYFSFADDATASPLFYARATLHI